MRFTKQRRSRGFDQRQYALPLFRSRKTTKPPRRKAVGDIASSNSVMKPLDPSTARHFSGRRDRRDRRARYPGKKQSPRQNGRGKQGFRQKNLWCNRHRLEMSIWKKMKSKPPLHLFLKYSISTSPANGTSGPASDTTSGSAQQDRQSGSVDAVSNCNSNV